MQRIFFLLLAAISLAALFTACEEEFTPPVSTDPEQIVVEGYIEGGDNPTPPYLFLTRSVPFFSRLGPDVFNRLFVNGATVTVSDGTRTVPLVEICLDQLTPEQRALAAEFLGVGADSLGINFCAYTDPTLSMRGEVGKQYDLRIEVEGRVLTATTTIPRTVPLDSLFFVPPPGEPNDTLLQLRTYISDPLGVPNYYRYFTQVNDEGLLVPNGGSVTDDTFFDGQRFQFPIPRAQPDSADFDLATFGLFQRGDTVTIKWMNIDEAHFNFWNTLEFSRNNQGPFSSYTRIRHNINGGIGIWGGLSANYYTLEVPKQ